MVSHQFVVHVWIFITHRGEAASWQQTKLWFHGKWFHFVKHSENHHQHLLALSFVTLLLLVSIMKTSPHSNA